MLAPVLALWGREIRRFLADRARVTSSLGQPILFWLLFAGALREARLVAGGSDWSRVGYGEYFFVGTLAMIALFTAVFATITVIEDRRDGFLQGVLVSPAPRVAIALGKVLGGTTLALGHCAVFLLLAPLAGIPLSAGGLLAAAGVLLLIAFALTSIGYALAWVMDSTAGYHGIMMLFLMPMWLLSGAMFPVQSAHPILAAIMHGNPLTYGVAALRLAFYGADAAVVAQLPPPALSLGVTIAFALLAFTLAVGVTLRRTVRDAG
jgi:ABC-2 type transport system permease protein